MTNTKYETFKKATFELLEAQGGGSTLEALKEITNMVDRLEDEPATSAKTAITKEEIMATKNSGKRIKLIKENMELFKGTNNELQNKFN